MRLKVSLNNDMVWTGAELRSGEIRRCLVQDLVRPVKLPVLPLQHHEPFTLGPGGASSITPLTLARQTDIRWASAKQPNIAKTERISAHCESRYSP